ncbi:WYL domain-containing protein [Cyanobium sp. T1G-Tous]|uniref:WYL domain-containing protein n=1 Tax=Cyanobium sp. T1G-Tous TaxID=2823722 RepID=UPI0020CE0320|nr:WYL domain-containing protein [Cyanobium sp. T1G-Tous]MCP9804485.1 WYL domain-containing protein [Cyanobium sp. T1G-Tous]
MKHLHLVLGDRHDSLHRIGALISEMIHGSHLLDYTDLATPEGVGKSFNAHQDEDRIVSECSEVLSEGSCLVILLPNSQKFLRLLFSEILLFSFQLRCVCWNICSDSSSLESGPSPNEGYDAFVEVDDAVNGLHERIANILQALPAMITNSSNRNSLKIRHRYSTLFAFERLMFVIRTFLKNPELYRSESLFDSDIRVHAPTGIEEVVRKLSELGRSGAYCRCLLSREDELIEDLSWLDSSGFIGEYPGFESFPEILFCEAPLGRQTPLRHPFAGWEEFSRLMVLIRHLIFNPGDWVKGESLNQYLAGRLSLYPGSLWTPTSEASVRHYLRVGVKPYVDNRAARKGHFLGSAVISLGDLSELVSIVSSSAPLLNSPQTQALVQSIEQRLVSLNVSPRNAQALSSLAERSIVNPETAPQGSVRSREPDFRELSASISRRQEIRIQTFASHGQQSSTSSGNQGDSALVLPLQFVFHRRAWYLAAEEREPGRADGPIRFLRLDRFRLLRVDHLQQKEERFSLAFSRMCRLVDRTFSLPPNKLSYQDQALVWSTNNSWMSADRTLTVCCRLDHRAWKFIREGPDRLPFPQLRMSGGRETHTTVWKPPGSLPHMDQIYCLPVHGNSDYPYELQMVLPAWSVDDFDLQNWLLGFGAGLVLTGPDSFRQKLLERLQSTITAWESPP